MERVTVDITGMTCDHCVRAVDGALRRVDGVTVEAVTVGQAVVSYEPAAVSRDRITQAIESEGYGATVVK